MVDARVSDLIGRGLAVAERARAASLAGTPGAGTPDGDDLNGPALTAGDLRARVDRATARAQAADRLCALAAEQTRTAPDPAARAAARLVCDRAADEARRALRVVRRAWDAHLAAAPGPAPAPARPGDVDPPAFPDPDRPADELARALGLDPDDPPDPADETG
jgi:hypothetical protein